VALDRAVLVLLDDEQVEKPDDVSTPEPIELRANLGGVFRIVEPDDEKLNWTHRHRFRPLSG
jgi:hypothetical protein